MVFSCWVEVNVSGDCRGCLTTSFAVSMIGESRWQKLKLPNGECIACFSVTLQLTERNCLCPLDEEEVVR